MNRQSRYLILAILFSALSLGSAPALSQDTGLYAGFGLGKSKVKDLCEGLTNCDDKDTALNIFAGYQANRNFGVELGYAELGKFSGSVPGISVTGEVTGFELSAVGTLPIDEKFALYGKLGFFMWDVDVRGSAGGFGFSGSDDGTDPTLAIGARYSLTRNVALQVQWQRYFDIGDSDIDVIGLGVLFRF
jgi:OmpA-OmpF porin, OOP family